MREEAEDGYLVDTPVRGDGDNGFTKCINSRHLETTRGK